MPLEPAPEPRPNPELDVVLLFADWARLLRRAVAGCPMLLAVGVPVPPMERKAMRGDEKSEVMLTAAGVGAAGAGF